MMPSRLFAIAFAGLLSMISGCAGGLGERNQFQSVGIGNGGKSDIRNVQVLYGRMELIRGPATATYRAGRPGQYFSQGFDSPIPEKTSARWKTDDGIAHNVSIPTRSLIRDPGSFYGFEFSITDDHVDVLLLERLPTPGPYLNIKSTKVYSAWSVKPGADAEKAASNPAGRP